MATENNCEAEMSKAEILADFEQACREVKAHREGKLELKTWEEFRDELRQEGYYD